MKKKSWDMNIYVSILMFIFTLYSLVIFAFVKEMNGFFWCSFALTTVMFVFQLVMNEYAEAKQIEVNDIIINKPIIVMGIIFMGIQVIYAMLFSFINISDYSMFFMIQFFTFAIYCAIVIGSLMSSIKNINKINSYNSYILYIAENIKRIEENAMDLNTRVMLHQLYNRIIKNSFESIAETLEIEARIQSKVINFNKISNICDSETIMSEIIEINKLFEERDRICRLAKS